MTQNVSLNIDKQVWGAIAGLFEFICWTTFADQVTIRHFPVIGWYILPTSCQTNFIKFCYVKFFASDSWS
ncbi:hypothetical protein [Dapis sp. BLCC M172]